MTPVSEVAQRLLQRDPEGVSISGGEPLDQAEGILALLTLLPPLPKGVLMYTGTTVKQRAQLPLWGEIRKRVDLLVAGPYVQERRVWPVTRLLSSSNQVLHYLGDKLGPADLEGGAQVEVIVGKEIRTLGFPREHDVCNP
jgi:anaerobic ribonucleoside-triphosphate reductase activating protein